MARNELTSEDISGGHELVSRLVGSSTFPIVAAFWLQSSDVENWRLIIATPILDQLGPLRTYNRLQDEVKSYGRGEEFLTSISVTSPRDPLVNLLKSAVSTGGTIGGIRFTGNVINGHYIDDAYIYIV